MVPNHTSQPRETYDSFPWRVLILCTHNSARSQMAEGWIRHLASKRRLRVDVHSAGTEGTYVKQEAIQVMAEVGIDISRHTSKTLDQVPDPWNFHLVITVCDRAAEACPVYPGKTRRIHVSFPDPTGHGLQTWRQVRDALGRMAETVVSALNQGRLPDADELRAVADNPPVLK